VSRNFNPTPSRLEHVLRTPQTPDGCKLGEGSWGKVFVYALRADPAREVALKFIVSASRGGAARGGAGVRATLPLTANALPRTSFPARTHQ